MIDLLYDYEPALVQKIFKHLRLDDIISILLAYPKNENDILGPPNSTKRKFSIQQLEKISQIEITCGTTSHFDCNHNI